MASLIPYGNYDRALRRAWPFDTFDDFFSPLATLSSDAAFKMDVEDAGDKYVISAELAGVNRDEIDVELNEGRLSISVNKKETEEKKGKNYLHKETTEWSATRGIYLKDASTSGLTARLEGGVLTVNVPKQEEKENVTKITID
ncbi:MAG: Hsp20 family protein [Olsenella sp.]|nr:Hsp20 family protein [Olsenella sp.]